MSYDDTVTLLANHFQPPQSAIYSRAHFHRRNEHVGENWLQYVTELRTFEERCRFATTGVEELIRDRLGRLLSHFAS